MERHLLFEMPHRALGSTELVYFFSQSDGFYHSVSTMISVAVDDHREPIEPIGSESRTCAIYYYRFLRARGSRCSRQGRRYNPICEARNGGMEEFLAARSWMFLLQKSSQFFVGFGQIQKYSQVK